MLLLLFGDADRPPTPALALYLVHLCPCGHSFSGDVAANASMLITFRSASSEVLILDASANRMPSAPVF